MRSYQIELKQQIDLTFDADLVESFFFDREDTETFVTVALTAARQFSVNIDSLHLDSSSFHVDGG